MVPRCRVVKRIRQGSQRVRRDEREDVEGNCSLEEEGEKTGVRKEMTNEVKVRLK